MERPKCGTCIYYEDYAGVGDGSCHHGPPTLHVGPGGEVGGHWPPVVASEWCGAHQDFESYAISLRAVGGRRPSGPREN